MKIKEVCQKTGLTDRAVRFYIENGLISPQENENYMGRRSFNFSNEDVKTLNTIATLRKSGFSIEEIQKLFTSDDTLSIVNNRIDELRKEHKKCENILSTLKKAKNEKNLTLTKLEEILNTPVINNELPKKDSELPFPRLLKKAKKIIISLSILCFISILSAALFLCAIFMTLDGYSTIEQRFHVGVALLTVYSDGQLLTCDKYNLSSNLPVTESENGHSIEIDYGEIRATLQLDNGKEIDLGFVNTNNWHHVFMTVEITNQNDAVQAVQQITYITENENIAVIESKAEIPASQTKASLFIEGI